ncbi:MAG: GNAT family N-acetyltransferase [Desulfobacterales bacterium]|nr:GNAT family N-acetyltransferase [Desulfobacterales bacterium]
MTIRIQQARVEDSAAIANVHVSSWLAAYDNIVPASVLKAQSVEKQEAFWRKTLNHRCDNVFVAFAPSNEVVGWVSFGPSRKNTATGEIYAIYIRPDYFRTGIGRSLWEAVCPRLEATGFSSVIALVITENRAARKFYESIGFILVPDSGSTFTWEGERIADVCYEYHFDT